MFDTDVFVIGGGPAGLAAAISARSRGLRVIVADGNRPPIDKACGEGLMPDAIATAARIGIVIPESEGFHFRGIRFHGEGHSVVADFPRGYGLGFRRTALHRHLVGQAGRAGVEMLWSTPIMGIEQSAVLTNVRRITTRWIIGADGAGSRVRRWAGLDRFTRNSQRFACRRHFAVKPWTDFMEIYWGDACQIYLTPVSPDEICVAFISRTPEVRLAEALRRFPQLESRLGSALPSSKERGAVTATSRLRAVARGNVALVGDASGSVDAITGQGHCQAFQQSEALACALVAGDLAHYTTQHRRIARRPSVMGDLMLTMDRWPLARRRALSAMSAHPRSFANLLAGHVGSLTPLQLLGAGVALGWNMVVS
jgi:2-polyprenyl-6-methoxyphenol hydroxylase-like FAD-dependent oxidoreductase